MTMERTPAEVFPPGEFIREEIETRGWSQAEFAEILGRPPRLVSELIAGKRGITPETAKGLAAAFGTSAQLWLNLESSFQLSRLKHNSSDEISRRAKLYEMVPVKEIVRRRWIEPSDNLDVLEKRVMDFLRAELIPHAARKSTSYSEEITPAQHAWLLRARQLCKAVSVSNSFTTTRFERLLEQLKSLLLSAEEVRHVPRLLAQAGIRFVVVEPLSQTRVDGATLWLSETAPAIVLSLRSDRVDWFWFTLMHELAHVKHQDGKDELLLDVDLLGESGEGKSAKPEIELRADAFASEFLVPPKDLRDFVVRVKPLFSKQRIKAFAARIGVHPGIVVGQLHHSGVISYAHSRELLEKVRGTITDAALTDGWGAMLPVSV
jgi:HTH-type transcriptional regulator/antitoxin HigA